MQQEKNCTNGKSWCWLEKLNVFRKICSRAMEGLIRDICTKNFIRKCNYKQLKWNILLFQSGDKIESEKCQKFKKSDTIVK